MLQISKLADYGLLIIDAIANKPNELQTAKKIAKTIPLSIATVSKILKLLTRHHLLISQRGNNGGYKLARPADQISLADIITAIDGEIALTACQTGLTRKGCCQLESCCTMRSNWQTIGKMFHNLLANISVDNVKQPLTKTMLTKIMLNLD